MENFEIIEADFQQYYNLDVSLVPFTRYCRLLLNLPIGSRFVNEYSPTKDWDFDKETNSRILLTLESISCQLANIFKKKGAQTQKPEGQFQPDYVKKAKEEAERGRPVSEEELDDMKDFWMSRNPNANYLEERKDD